LKRRQNRRCGAIASDLPKILSQAPREEELRNPPRTEPVNLSGELNGLFGDSDSAEEELLKETPILTPATTQAPTLVVEQAATAATIQLPGQTTRKARRRIDSATESEPELILTAENEEEELKNVALKTLP
jgi:hypothetical protein